MVAGIETHGKRAAYVGGRDMPAWHKLGKTVAGTLTVEEALREAHMDEWNVRVVPLTAKHNGADIEVPGKNMVIRDSPFVEGQIDPLGIVGDRYTVIQNEDAFAFGQNILDSSSAVVDTMGSLFGGTLVFSTMIMPEEIVIDDAGANDRLEYYLVIFTSHDGSKPTKAMIVAVRVVCWNTLSMAIGSAISSFSVRHTSGVEGRLHDARTALKLSYKHASAFEDEVRALYETPMTAAQFYNVYTDLNPRPKDDVNDEGEVINKASITRWDNKYDFVSGLFTGGNDEVELDTLTNIRGTAWAGLNAMTEYEDWYRQVRGDNGEQNRLISTTGVDADRFGAKSKVFSRFRQFADDNRKIVVPV